MTLRTCPSARRTLAPTLNAALLAVEAGIDSAGAARQTPLSQSVLVKPLIFALRVTVVDAVLSASAANTAEEAVTPPSTAARAMEATSALREPAKTLIDIFLSET
ncbi:hypothetical protein D3C77_630690 [compost metagenome]